jgi:AcrR family transcriptional regulator
MAKEALNIIDSKKRDRIFRTAAAEFARHGYHKANVNSIAQRAGIGKGSIYLYFKDKRDLYHSTLFEAARMQEEVFDSIENSSLAPMAKIEKVFEESIGAFPRYRNMFKMYFDLMSSGTDKSPANLARSMETRSAEFFQNVLREGIEAGDVRKNLSIKHAAYLIDCVYSLFFTALASTYQRERFRVFTDADISKGKDLVRTHMKKILDVIDGGIGV